MARVNPSISVGCHAPLPTKNQPAKSGRKHDTFLGGIRRKNKDVSPLISNFSHVFFCVINHPRLWFIATNVLNQLSIQDASRALVEVKYAVCVRTAARVRYRSKRVSNE